MRLSALRRACGAAAGVTTALLCAAPAAAAPRAVTIDGLGAPVPAKPLLVDLSADVPLTGRAAPRAEVDVTAPCSLRACGMRVRADRRGRWKARLHVVVPPRRTALLVRAGAPLERPASRIVMLRPPEPLAGGPELALIGDSLAQGVEPYLPSLLPGWRVSVDGGRGRALWTGIAIRDTMRKPASRPVALAFSLFTNDDPRRAAELVVAVRQSLGGLPPGSCAIWATIARPRVRGVSYAAANRALEQLAREDRPGRRRIVVVPWARAVEAHPQWLRRDRVHATDEGYRARAALYAAAAESCALE